MFRVMKWATPVVALALLFSFNSVVRAQEANASQEAGSVSGKVVDGEGNTVSGAVVRLMKPFARGRGGAEGAGKAEKQAKRGNRPAQQLAAKPGKGDRPKPIATATTDAEGKFTLNDIPAGEYVVAAMLRGQGNARQPVTVKAGETATVDLKLKQRGGKGGEKPAKRKKSKKEAVAE